MADIREAKWRQSQLPQRDVPCVFCHANKLCKYKQRVEQWLKGLRGCWQNVIDLWEEQRNWRPCNLYSNNDYASTLCLAVGKKKHNCTSLWEICIFHFLWEQLCRYLSKSVTKLEWIFENIAANFLIVAFVCPFITFFFCHWRSLQFGRNMGISLCLL